jgi:hypothetical protein
MTRFLQRLLRREPPREAPCPRCGVLAPADATDCTACGWDLRESYHGPVGSHEMTTPEPNRNH